MHTRRTVVAVVVLGALFVAVWMLPAAAAAGGLREPAKPELDAGQTPSLTLSAGNGNLLPDGMLLGDN